MSLLWANKFDKVLKMSYEETVQQVVEVASGHHSTLNYLLMNFEERFQREIVTFVTKSCRVELLEMVGRAGLNRVIHSRAWIRVGF